MRTIAPHRPVMVIAPAGLMFALGACSGSSTSTSSLGSTTNLGGNVNSAGTATGGAEDASPTGGSTSSMQINTGGTAATATGGTPGQGGAAPLGGTANGGVSATGGISAIGGTTGAAGSHNLSGGTQSTGGSKSTGGSRSSGGTSSTGGTPSNSGTNTGGLPQVGGSWSGGGTSNVGGTQPNGGTGNIGGGTNAGGTASASGGAPASATELCTRWAADRADLSEAGWTGDANSCTAGDMSATARANALRQVNLFRWIAGQGPVTTSDQYNQDDQACALMMQANNDLSHTPDSSWKCYTSAGAAAAQNSCIAGEGAVTAALGYMIDPGNSTTLGHRRWILSNYLGPIGIGSTGKYSCMYTGTTGKLKNAWTAWPPPGYFPSQAVSNSWGQSINTTGFSVQSDTINLANASVTITLNDAPLNVTVTQLQSGYGSKYAISMIPSGWTIAAGSTYHVSITGISTAIAYDVQVVSCT